MECTLSGKFAGWLTCLLLFWIAAPTVNGQRTLDRCTLAREMDNMGVPRNQLAQWACIAQHESSYKTWVVGPPNTDGSLDYGIFQINDRYWCKSPGRPSKNICNIMCNALLTDHIDASVRCALKVLEEQNWNAWSVYERYCDQRLPSIEDCFGSNYRHGIWGAGGMSHGCS